MNSRIAGAITAGLILVGACGGDGDGGPGPGPNGLAGTWRATRVEMVNSANPSQKVELIGLGATLTISFDDDQTCVMVETFPGEPDEIHHGTWNSSRDVLTIQYTQGPYTITYQFDWALSANTLTLSGAHGMFDFDGDDIDDDAILNLVLVRQ